MSKPQAPIPPDYAAAAQQQGQANVNSAVASNRLNQVNQVTPQGSLTYTYGKVGDPNGGYTDPQTGQWIPQVTATTTLSPEQQRLYDQNAQISTSLNDLAQKGIGYVADASSTPIDQSSLPSMARGLAVPAFNTNLTIPGQAQTSVDNPALGENRFSMVGNVDPQRFQTSYDFSNVGSMPKASDFQSQRDQITDAMMQRLQPYLDRQRDQMNTRLATQGITNGSEAWKWDQDTFNRSENDQRIAALLAGDQAQQNAFNNAMGIRQQGVSEAVSQGNFANNAAQGMFSQGLANAGLANSVQQQQFAQNLGAQGQQFQQNLATMQAENQGQQQNFAQQLAAQQANNQAQQAQFQTGLASSQFQNQARQQAIQEADYFKNQPLNMLNALRTGNQVTMPGFGNVAGGAQINAAPVYQATSDQYNAALQAYQTQMAGYGGLMSGLGSLGGAAMSFIPGFGGKK